MGTGYRQWLAGIFCIIALVFCAASASWGVVRHVCASGCTYSSIQAAIDAAVYGDTVLVHDGTYVGQIDFKGKVVTVRSVNGPGATIIDGGMIGGEGVVAFISGEGRNSVLDGFTVTKGGQSGIGCKGSSPTIRQCIISGNTASWIGGGIYSETANPLIENCIISGNSSDSGGGILCAWNSSPVIVNCTISGNLANRGGGICCNTSSRTVITNCTIAGNRAWIEGGGLLNVVEFTETTVVNSILWGNAAGGDGSQIRHVNGDLWVSFSDVQDGWTGEGNINASPGFVDPRDAVIAPTSEGDYRITAGSPCIDKGALTGPSYDIAWDPRPQGAGWDIGSDEFAILTNGSFEEAAQRVPAPWVGKFLSLKDGRFTGAPHGGRASFLMNGSKAAKQLSQTLALSGSAGDVFQVACWHRAYRPSALGGFFGLKLTVFHADATRRTYTSGFLKRTHGWLKARRAFTALKNYTRFRVSLMYANQTGKAWFDDVQLSVLPPP